MSSLSLSPTHASEISKNAYAMLEYTDIGEALENTAKGLGIRGIFAPSIGAKEAVNVNRVTGKTGLSLLSRLLKLARI